MTFCFDLLAILVSGVMVGVEVSVAAFVNPILRGLSLDAELAGRSHGARLVGRVMPFWYVSTLLLMLLSAWRHGFDRWVTSSAVLLTIVIVATLLYLVPINNRIGSWNSTNAPSDWKIQERRWSRGHQLRVATLIVAEVLLIGGVLSQG